METVSMKQIIRAYDDFCDDKITKEDFANIIAKTLKVKKYISILDKSIIVEKIFNYVNNIDIIGIGGHNVALELEIRFLFAGLLSYTNVEFEKEDISIPNYDKLMASTIYETIYSICGKDFEFLKAMFNETLVANTMGYFSNFFNGQGAKDNIKQIEKISKVLKSANLETMSEIIKFSAKNAVIKETKMPEIKKKKKK